MISLRFDAINGLDLFAAPINPRIELSQGFFVLHLEVSRIFIKNLFALAAENDNL